MTVSIFFCCLHIHVQPIDDPILNRVEQGGLLLTIAIFLGGMVLFSPACTDASVPVGLRDPTCPRAMSVFIFLLFLIFIVSAAVGLMQQLLRWEQIRKVEARRESVKLCQVSPSFDVDDKGGEQEEKDSGSIKDPEILGEETKFEEENTQGDIEMVVTTAWK